METLEFIKTIINDLGFPFAMVLYFIWDKTKITNQLTDAINNNNEVLTKILEHFRNGDMIHE